MDKLIKEQVKTATITVPEKISVFTDERTKVKSVAFPFTFMTDGLPGIVTLTKQTKGYWNPADDIKEIIIVFK